jgi:predicted metalloprotease with PDZ domain
MAAEICNEYGRVFGGVPVPKIDVYLIPMPQPGVSKGVWEAETRGSTVVIASSDMPFRTQSVQRLHEQLRHEIFHLWFPNGVDLTGRYDWFYEGAALYESLKTGVAVNRIGFTDMLDTLSRAYGIDSSMMPRRSLIDASRDRLRGNETQLYARGMIVAFLTDLVLLQRSRGRRSIETMLAELYRSYKGAALPADGNAAVLALYDASPELRTLAADHIRGAKPIDWAGIIEAAGLEHGPGIPLRVRARISGRQKALLDKLGYNNWRKLTRK